MITLMLLAGLVAGGTEPDSIPWTRFVGNVNTTAPWAGWVRGPSQVPRLPYDSVLRAITELPNDIAMTVDPTVFLPDRYSLTDTDFRYIEADSGRSWRAAISAGLDRIVDAGVDLSRIEWQVGNEINSPRVGRAVMAFQGEADGHASLNDDSIIPLYAEAVLAPAAEALRHWFASSRSRSGPPRIVLGSVANASNQRSLVWLSRLLGYRLKGLYAPTLRGQTVADLVDVISIHYLVTAAGSEWSSLLDGIWGRWDGQGRVSGIWATEELGRRRAEEGRGAATAVRVAARWLWWIQSHELDPDQARWALWGGTLGPTGSQGQDGMAMLLRVLGNQPLKVVSLESGDGPGSIETYLLRGTRRPDRWAVVAFASRFTDPATISEVLIPGRISRARAMVLDEGTLKDVSVTAGPSADSANTVVAPEPALALRPGAVLVISSRR